MKIHLNKSFFILTVILSLGGISCLKDKAFDNGTIQSGSGGSGRMLKWLRWA